MPIDVGKYRTIPSLVLLNDVIMTIHVYGERGRLVAMVPNCQELGPNQGVLSILYITELKTGNDETLIYRSDEPVNGPRSSTKFCETDDYARLHFMQPTLQKLQEFVYETLPHP